MREFLNFIKNSHFFIIFVILETFSFFLIVKNTGRESRFLSSANIIAGKVHSGVNAVSEYFSLKSKNEKLIEENTKLRNFISSVPVNSQRYSTDIERYGYFYKSAKVVKSSTNKEHNILTVDKGTADGINEDMAVVSGNGAVGIIGVSGKHFSTVIPLLNTKLEISAKVKRTGYHGILKWDGTDYRFVTLYDIPVHSSLFKGDEIVTGGYSAIFPEGIKIGTVYDFYKDEKSTFYDIKVKLSQDFKKLDYVYIIDHKSKNERKAVEDSTAAKFRFNTF